MSCISVTYKSYSFLGERVLPTGKDLSKSGIGMPLLALDDDEVADLPPTVAARRKVRIGLRPQEFTPVFLLRALVPKSDYYIKKIVRTYRGTTFEVYTNLMTPRPSEIMDGAIEGTPGREGGCIA